jgi:hypothetical protein
MGKYLNIIKKAVKGEERKTISRSAWESQTTQNDKAIEGSFLMEQGYDYQGRSEYAPDDSYLDIYTKKNIDKEEAIKIIRFLEKTFELE